MAEARNANPLVDQFRKGGVPRDLRLMAAQGALPLKPGDFLELLHLLLSDKDDEIRTVADATLMGLAPAEMLPILKDKETLPEILGWALVHRPEAELREVALQNTSTPDQVIEDEVARLPEALAELVVINQVRLLRRTSLLEALESSANLSKDQRRRLRELRETFHIGEEPAAPVAQAPAPVVVPEPEPEPEPEPIAFQEPASPDEAVARYLTDEERHEEQKVSAVQKLYRLNAAQKVIAALKGTREERAVLVRDPNRIVASAVLGSPRLTDAEVEAFAAMKNVSDETLRKIGNNREWTKRYTVVANLVKNPRTPLGISLGMVPRLNPRDIKAISMDRNVPEAIRKVAQRFVKDAQEGGKKK